jgi:hypothetical protein
MKRQLKRIIGLLSFIFLLSSNVAFASENYIPTEDTSIVQETVFEDTIVQPRVMYIKTLERYDPTFTTVNYEARLMGQVTVDNRGNTEPATLHYQNTTSSTFTASISNTSNVSAEAGVLFAKCSAQTGLTVGASKSWTSGTMTGISMVVSPGNFGKLRAYCPGITTSGGFVYKVYNLDYPSNYWYETTSVSNAIAPITNYVHYIPEQKPIVF